MAVALVVRVLFVKAVGAGVARVARLGTWQSEGVVSVVVRVYMTRLIGWVWTEVVGAVVRVVVLLV